MCQLDIFSAETPGPKPQCGHLRLLYATSMLSVYEGRMIALVCSSLPRFRAAALTALFASGIGLAGCAGLGDGVASGAFVDPAKYELYNCTQLETERKNLAARAEDLEGLMAKADTGAGGACGVGACVSQRPHYRARPGQACRRSLAARQMPGHAAAARHRLRLRRLRIPGKSIHISIRAGCN